MKEYLLSKLKERPSDVDVICTLASVKLELGEGDTEYIKLLEDFLDRFSNEVDDKQVARIYTNIAFIEDYSRRALDYLTKAKDLKSPYVETYKASDFIIFLIMISLKRKRISNVVMSFLSMQESSRIVMNLILTMGHHFMRLENIKRRKRYLRN